MKETLTVTLCGHEVPVTLTRKKMTSIVVRVRRGKLEASCGPWAATADVLKLIRANEQRLWQRVSAYTPYVDARDGGHVMIFGERYEIRVRDLKKKMCRIHNHTVYVYDKNIEKTLEAFLKQTLLDYVTRRIDDYVSDDADLIRPQKVDVRFYKSRWGACYYKDSRVSFNLSLVYMPYDEIDSVVVHELCHFLEPSHNACFYREVKRRMPDYDIIHKRLKEKDV